MKTTFLNIVLILSWLMLHPASIQSAEFYVSPKGNDSNPGTVKKPFATIEHALKAVEESFSKKPDKDCTVWLESEKHFIKKQIIINSENMKNRSGNLFIKALPGKTPVISGGFQLKSWQPVSNGLWKSVPNENFSNNPPRELFTGHIRATRARHPNSGYLHVKKTGEDRRTNFFFEPNDFPVPQNISETELVLLHDWSITRIPVKEIDTDEYKITAVDSIGAKSPAFFNIDNWEPDPRYYLENAMEFLDADYEWFFNKSENTFYLKLPETVNPNDIEIFIPLSEGLISLGGNEKESLKNIHFEGISFRHSAWNIPQKGYCGIQACHFDPRPGNDSWAVVPAAVQGEWLNNITFKNCSFENLGGSGIWLGTGSQNCEISNSNFHDISGNGIMIGEGQDRKINNESWWKTAPHQAATGNIINNCTITACGKQFYGAVGIWCGLTAKTTIIRNRLSNLPYTGISIGWMWSPVPTPCHENIISGNHIHHIMQTLSDGGGIYMLGLQPESKITNNHIHDVSLNAGRAESNGMFLDEGTTDVIIENNLIYNIAKSPLRFHQATVNLVKNNKLFCNTGIPAIMYNSTKEEDIKKVDNQIIDKDDNNYDTLLKQAVSVWKIFH